MLNRTELGVTKEVAQKVRALRRGFNRLRAEQWETDRVAIERYAPKEEFAKISRTIGRRAVSPLRKLGIDYWTFHQVMLLYQSIEREKTGQHYTSSTWTLFWAMGHEDVSGHSGI